MERAFRIANLFLICFICAAHLHPLGDHLSGIETFPYVDEMIALTSDDSSTESKNTFLTIFSTLKPTKEESLRIRHKNAINSWSHLDPKPDIILMGDEDGVQELSEEFGCLYVPDIVRSEEFHPMPLVNKLFEKANDLANSSLLLYTNGDIILMNDLMRSLQRVEEHFKGKPFLVVGKRFDFNAPNLIQFDKDEKWQLPIRNSFSQSKFSWEQNAVNLKWTIDFFAFTKDFWNNKRLTIPPFLIGVQVFDNWLVHQPNVEGMIVVDVSQTALVVHQSHEWTHATEKQKQMKDYNVRMAGNRWSFGNTDRAKYYTEYCNDGKDVCIKQR